ncbi:MAG: carboxypeptidase regulatory-like domain-containing protein [Bacteroidota bacterium]
MKYFSKIILVSFLSVLTFSSCRKDDKEDQPPMGTLEGTITSEVTGEILSGARIDIYLENGDPAEIDLVSDENGYYETEIKPGNYSARIHMQGYESIPQVGIMPVGFSIIDDETTTKDYAMDESEVVNGGWISGKVTSDANPVAGVMMVAYSGSHTYSALSNGNGEYTIYNVPAGSYSLRGWKQDYNSEALALSVEENTEKTQHYTMAGGALGALNGTITFLATQNGIVDVTLIDPESNQAIPGLSVATDENGSYTLTGVPNGTYIARASYKNDTYVIDPDWIFKFGEPFVTINDDEINKDFSVTGAVTLTGASNAYPDAIPVEITETAPTFTWAAYSSTSDYAFELSDAEGNIVWGGITGAYGSMVKKVVIDPKTEGTSYTYPSDGSAPALETGKIYRWRVYASKDNIQAQEGWALISVSEDQMGLFVIVE